MVDTDVGSIVGGDELITEGYVLGFNDGELLASSGLLLLVGSKHNSNSRMGVGGGSEATTVASGNNKVFDNLSTNLVLSVSESVRNHAGHKVYVEGGNGRILVVVSV